MASNKKTNTTGLFKRKNSNTKKSLSGKEKQNQQQEPKRRSVTERYEPRSTNRPYKLNDESNEDGDASSAESDDLFFFSREERLESRASRSVSRFDAWLNLSDLKEPLARSPSAARELRTPAETTSLVSPMPAEAREEQKVEAAAYRDNDDNWDKGEIWPTQDKITFTQNSTPSAFDENSSSQTALYKARIDSQEATPPDKGAETVTQTHLWKLDESLVLSDQFQPCLEPAANPAPARYDSRLPPLVKNRASYQRSASLPSESILATTGLISAKWAEQSNQKTGRSCAVRMPESFPGVYISRPPTEGEGQSESASDEELGSLVQKRSPTPPTRGAAKLANHLRVPSSAPKPPRSTSSSPGPIRNPGNEDEPMAMRWASSEFLAARVVSELDTAFTQTVSEGAALGRHDKCFTPNLMARSSSLASPRLRSFLPGDTDSVRALSSVYKANSISMPNLSGDQPRRVFVTFEQNFPRASAVNLQARSEVAARCRHLNRKMDQPKKPAKKTTKKRPVVRIAHPANPEQKTVMIRRWVESCSPRGAIERRAARFPAHTKPAGQLVLGPGQRN